MYENYNIVNRKKKNKKKKDEDVSIGEQILCEFCGNAVNSKKNLYRHLRKYHKIANNYACTQCEKFFFTNHALDVHLQSHNRHIKINLECKVCKKKFVSNRGLKKHLETLTHKILVEAEEADDEIKDLNEIDKDISNKADENSTEDNEAKNEEDETVNKEKVLCEFCGKSLSTRRTFYLHSQLHTNANNYGCNQCERKFYTSESLKKHLLTHREIKVTGLECNICKQKFISSYNFKLHLMTRKHIMLEVAYKRKHNKSSDGENIEINDTSLNPEFSECKEIIKTDEEFIRNESGEYICKICKKTLSTRSIFLRHFKIHNSEVNYACTQCEKTFSRKDCLQSHLKTHSKLKTDIISNDDIIKLEECEKSELDSNDSKIYAECEKNELDSNDSKIYAKCEKIDIDVNTEIFDTEFCDVPVNEDDFEDEDYEDTLVVEKKSINNDIEVQSEGTNESNTITQNVKESTTCNICQKICMSKYHLKQHVYSHQRRMELKQESIKLILKDDFTCKICHKNCMSSSHLDQHLILHEGGMEFNEDGKIICKICRKSLSTRRVYFRHLKIHDNMKEFACTVCEKKFNRKDYLQSHLKLHGVFISNQPECKACEHKFNCRSDLLKHLQTEKHKLREKVYKKNELKRQNLKEIESNNDKKHFENSQCEEINTDVNDISLKVKVSNLLEHEGYSLPNDDGHDKSLIHDILQNNDENEIQNEKSNEKNIAFEEPLLNFYHKNFNGDKNKKTDEELMAIQELEKYEYGVYNNKKNIPCKICGKVLKTHNSFYAHLLLHQNIKNYVCPHCDRKFLRKDALKSHLKLHGVNLNKHSECKICDYKFGRHGDYLKHLKTKRHKIFEKVYKKRQSKKRNLQEAGSNNDGHFENSQCEEVNIKMNDTSLKVECNNVVNNASENEDDYLPDDKNNKRSISDILQNNDDKKVKTDEELMAVQELEKYECGEYNNKVNIHCKICGRILKTHQSFYYHLLLHQNIKNCPHCDRKFLRRDALKSHLKTHGVNLNKHTECKICKHKFGCRNTYLKHLKTRKHQVLEKLYKKRQLKKNNLQEDGSNNDEEYFENSHCKEDDTEIKDTSVQIECNERATKSKLSEHEDDNLSGFSGDDRNEVNYNDEDDDDDDDNKLLINFILENNKSNNDNDIIQSKKDTQILETIENSSLCEEIDVKMSDTPLKIECNEDYLTNNDVLKNNYNKIEIKTEKTNENSITDQESLSNLENKNLNERAMAEEELEKYVYGAYVNKAKIPCKICGTILKTSKTYYSHLLLHKNANQYPCTHCEKKFNSKDCLLSHLRIHGVYLKTFRECKICGVKCTTPSKLKEHFSTINHKIRLEKHEKGELEIGSSKENDTSDVKYKKRIKKENISKTSNYFVTEFCNVSLNENDYLLEEDKLDCKNEEIIENCLNSADEKSNKKLQKKKKKIDKSVKKEKILCKICGKYISSAVRYEQHLKIHKKTYEHECTNCGKKFKKKHLLQQHLRNHGIYVKNFPECKICEKKFRSPSDLDRHYLSNKHKIRMEMNEKNELKQKKLKVTDNDEEDVTEDEVIDEIRLKRREYKTKCKLCGEVFDRYEQLDRHIIKKHTEEKNEKFECSLCLKKFVREDNYQLHMVIHNDLSNTNPSTELSYEMKFKPEFLLEKDKKCFICEKTFGKLYRLKRHLRIHDREDSYGQTYKVTPRVECKKCLKIFNNKYSLTVHLRSGTDCSNPKPKTVVQNSQKQLCPLCGLQISSCSLKIHIKRHSKEKTHKCHLCERSFLLPYELKCHLLTHLKEKTYVCSVCGKGFSCQNPYSKHMKTHSDVTVLTYKCMYCSRVFKQSSALTHHVRRHTGEKPYKCGKCNQQFFRISYLQAHQQSEGHQETQSDYVLPVNRLYDENVFNMGCNAEPQNKFLS